MNPIAVYVVKRADEYHAAWGWTRSRALATRYATREHAKRVAGFIHGSRIVRLRTRPASERLYLAARLAAWEPVVRMVGVLAAADKRGDIHSDNGVWAALARLVRLHDALPEEHRP